MIKEIATTMEASMTNNPLTNKCIHQTLKKKQSLSCPIPGKKDRK